MNIKNIVIGIVSVSGIATFLFFSVPENVEIPATPTPIVINGNVLQKYDVDYNCTLPNFNYNEIDKANLSGKILYACNFSKEHPDTHIFPDNLHDATFVCNNLDNVFIPEDNIIIDNNGTCGSHRTFEAQDDDKDWLLDEEGNPITPL